MQIVKAVIGSFALVILVATSPAIAQSRTEQLRGDFGIAGSTVCVNSLAILSPTYVPPAGFNSNLTPNPGPTALVTSNVNGVRTFNGDGTGSVSARVVSVSQGGASAVDFTASFTYSVAADGTITLDQGPSTATSVVPIAGQQSSVSDVPTFVGHLSRDAKSLTLATFDPGVETVTRSDGLVTTLRICQRASSEFRIGGAGSGGFGD